jgi:glycerol-3-phosphate cytidylyltransferase
MINKKKIGYTTGVFDLFHIGHLNILKKAYSKCDFLIVGVTACETVFKYKKRYPVIPLKERLEIIKSLKYVDKVVVQKNMDKFAAWEDLKFDVLFHGNDWKGSKMYDEIEKKLNSKGVEVEFFEYTKGTSTSSLKKYIYEEYKKDSKST